MRLGPLVATVGCSICAALIGGCGGSPSPEMPPSATARDANATARGANPARAKHPVGTASPEATSAPAGSNPVRSFEKEAALRTYLADRFIFEAWYPEVREIAVRGDVAAVSARLSADGAERKVVARDICAAALASGLVGEVHVTDDPGLSVAC